MTGFMDLKGFLPELDGDNNTFFVTTSVIHVLDIIHDNHISPVREYSFSTGNRSVFLKVRRNKLKKKYKELASNSSSTIKKRILACIASADVDIAYCVLRKEQVYPHLRSNHQIVYNYLTGSLISPVIQRFHDGSRVEITVDTSLNGIQREAFDQYLVYKTFEKNQANDLATIPIEIEHADSKNEPCIQAIDFIAGALHYYYRTDDNTFSGIINKKVTLAFDYFKGPQK